MWIEDGLKSCLSDLMDASLYLKPPFEGLAETVTHRHLSAAAISKRRFG